MNWRSIRAVIYKDFSLFFRNRFFAVVTLLGLVFYSLIYFVMPSTVDETLEIGFYTPSVPPALVYLQQQQRGLELERVESEEALRESVIDGQYVAGLVLPEDLVEKLASHQTPEIKVYFTADTPGEIKDVLGVIITEMAFMQTGETLDIELQQVTLGRDMVGSQVPQRDRMRSLFAVFILMTETFGLASLMSEEVERQTAQALLATPMTVKDLFTAKGILGTLLAFVQAVLIMAVVGAMGEQTVIILIALLLGAVLVTGVGFLIASVGKDFMSIVAWGAPTLILLSVPAIGILIPGEVSAWIKVIPSYYLVDTISDVSNFGAGWSDVWSNLLILVGFNLAILSAGILALGRKFQ